ncbi:bile acid:sodium symporter family protein, partial [Xanthomonas citri pv. citri]|nr:bile acid:sodium symporter family protein [Xanthomonas citri pv. citri]
WHNLSGAVLAMAYRRSDGRRAAGVPGSAPANRLRN